jgi:hypothetical protein
MTTTPEEDAPLLLDVPLEEPPAEAPAAAEEPAPPAWHELPTARQQLAAKITLEHPEITAHPYIMQPENVTLGKPVASVYRATLENASQSNVLRHDVTIDLFVALTDGPEAEAEAEDALDKVLLTLQRTEGVTWTTAKRVNFGTDFAGYTISASKFSKDHYLQTVLAERQAG